MFREITAYHQPKQIEIILICHFNAGYVGWDNYIIKPYVDTREVWEKLLEIIPDNELTEHQKEQQDQTEH